MARWAIFLSVFLAAAAAADAQGPAGQPQVPPIAQTFFAPSSMPPAALTDAPHFALPTESVLQATSPPTASATPGGTVPDAAASGGAARNPVQEDNGTNPATNTTNFTMRNEFTHLKGGNDINTSYASFKFPILDQRGSVLFQVPFVFNDFTGTNPDLPQTGGLGDVKFQLTYNSWMSEDKRFTVVNFLEAWVPSADNVLIAREPNSNEFTAFNLGTGKYVLGPGIGFVYAFQPNIIIAPLYFYEVSVAGDPDKARIRRGKWRLFAMYAWESGIYVLPEVNIQTNYLTGNNDFYVAPEIGYSLKRTTFYVKPGIGIAPDVNDRQWGIEFGVRCQF
jgi:hypothetical protein